MLYIKVAGVVLIMLAALFLSLERVVSMSDRLVFLRDSRAAMIFCREQMFFYREEIRSILSSSELKTKHSACQRVFLDIYNDKKVNVGFLKNRDLEVITEFVCSLGMSDIENQNERCELMLKEISEQIKSAKEELNSKAKLYAACVMSAGLCISLIML